MVNSNPSDPAHELTNLIRSLQQQGILDEQFSRIEDMRRSNNPLFLSQIIQSYVHDAEQCIAEINQKLSQTLIDYAKVNLIAHRLKGCSLSLGGCRVVHASQDFQRACIDNDQQTCFASFEKVKQEYDMLQANLSRVAELERASGGN